MKLPLMNIAGTTDNNAVTRTVMMRMPVVGTTLRTESTALMRVSEPPYMFSAVTDARPSTEKINAMAPKPLNTWSPALLIAATPRPKSSLLTPDHQVASAAPRHISQPPPSADPKYVHRNVSRIPTLGG